MTMGDDARSSRAPDWRRYGARAGALLVALAPGCGGTVDEEESVHWIEPLPEHAAAARKDGGDVGTLSFGASPDGHRALARSYWSGPTGSGSAMVIWDQDQGTRALGTLSGWVIGDVYVFNPNLTTMLGANPDDSYRSFRWTKD